RGTPARRAANPPGFATPPAGLPPRHSTGPGLWAGWFAGPGRAGPSSPRVAAGHSPPAGRRAGPGVPGFPSLRSLPSPISLAELSGSWDVYLERRDGKELAARDGYAQEHHRRGGRRLSSGSAPALRISILPVAGFVPFRSRPIFRTLSSGAPL